MVEVSGLINFKGDVVYTQVDGSVAAIWPVIPTSWVNQNTFKNLVVTIQVIDLSAKL